MAIYMKYGSVQGDVTESKHANWIELNSLQWGVGRGVAGATGSAADREASAPSISELTITKALDKASILLLTEAYQGDGSGNAATVQIDMCRTNKDQMQIYQTFILSNVIISGFSWSSGGDRPSESLSMNFTKIETDFIPMKADGTADNAVKLTYDVAQAKTV